MHAAADAQASLGEGLMETCFSCTVAGPVTADAAVTWAKKNVDLMKLAMVAALYCTFTRAARIVGENAPTHTHIRLVAALAG